MNEMRILNVKFAPSKMENPFIRNDPSQPEQVDWNARFSATERTYLYRILHSCLDERDWAAPFEWDRAWRIHQPLDVAAMRQAATLMRGTHDVTSFRTRGCQRSSPIVTISDVDLQTVPYGPPLSMYGTGGPAYSGLLNLTDSPSDTLLLTTVLVRGNAFVYRQVRNMVGCLVAVGKGQMSASAVSDLIASRNRSCAPDMAPAHGLFLARVRHGDFDI